MYHTQPDGEPVFHPSGLCKRCYDRFKQDRRDRRVGGWE